MDEIDEAITSLLQIDGRLTHEELARSVGMSRPSVAARMQRLVASQQIVIRGVVHPAVLGLGFLAHVAIDVSGSARSVADRAAERADTPFVSLTTGLHGLVAEIRAGSTFDVDRAVDELRTMDGVRGVETLSYVEVVRDVVGPVGSVTYEVDALDLALLRALQRDGRASYVGLGALVGLSAAGARRRVLRLIEEKVVRIGAVVRQSGSDRQSAALGFGIRLAGPQREPLAALAALPRVTFIARTLGRFDLLASARASTNVHLLDTLDQVRDIPGVSAVESWTHLSVVKESYALDSL
jgi:DNA-binding Lrp family transcriptional regulator